MSCYNIATESTISALAQRTKQYRHLIVAVVILIFTVIIWSIIERQIAILSGLLLLFPLCNLFFLLDVRLLNRWRLLLLQLWIKQKLDLKLLRNALLNIPNLPPNTLRPMLDSLPNISDKQDINPATRKAIVTTVVADHNDYVWDAAVRTVNLMIMASSLVTALVIGQWYPLLALLLIPLTLFLRYGIHNRRQVITAKKIHTFQTDAEFNPDAYRSAVTALGIKNQ